MRKYLPLVFFLVLSSFVSGQSIFTLKFIGKDSLSKNLIALDSVYVKNAARACDTTIYGAVPSLAMKFLPSVGIGIIHNTNAGDLVPGQNYPNPFTGTTNVNIYTGHQGPLNLKLLDVLGRQLAVYQHEFEKGSHSFKISTSGHGILVLQVSDHNSKQSIKILSTEPGQAENTIEYLGLSPDADYRPLKSGAAVPGFIIHLGDQLIYKTYAKGYQGKTLTDIPTTNKTYTLNLSKSDLLTVTTSSVTNITETSATIGSTVVSDGVDIVTSRGVCWAVTVHPDVTGNHTIDGTGTGTFVSQITNLTAGTLYYARAYATNSSGTTYGNEVQIRAAILIPAPEFVTYRTRVLADAGVIRNEANTDGYIKFLKTAGTYASTKLLWNGEMGSIPRISGIYNYSTKAYDANLNNALLGPELTVNGGFGSDTGWIKGTGYTISGGLMNINVLNDISYTYQSYIYTQTKYTKISFTVSNFVSGSISVYIGAGSRYYANANGTYTFDVKAGNLVYIQAGGSGFVGSIDNLSVKELSANDLLQSTDLNQPLLLSDGSSKQYLSNAAAGTAFMSHPVIGYAANEPWSLQCLIKRDGSANAQVSFLGNGSDLLSNISLRIGSDNRFSFTNESGVTVSGVSGGTADMIGVNTLVTLVAPGNGTLLIYKNGIWFETLTVATDIKLSRIINGAASAGREFAGAFYGYRIQSGAITAQQVAAENTYLRTIYK